MVKFMNPTLISYILNESHLNKLYFKKEKLKNHHITILGNAFDADNKYDSLDCKAF